MKDAATIIRDFDIRNSVLYDALNGSFPYDDESLLNTAETLCKATSDFILGIMAVNSILAAIKGEEIEKEYHIENLASYHMSVFLKSTSEIMLFVQDKGLEALRELQRRHCKQKPEELT